MDVIPLPDSWRTNWETFGTYIHFKKKQEQLWFGKTDLNFLPIVVNMLQKEAFKAWIVKRCLDVL